MNSYAQVFFSRNKAFALLLVLVSFFDLWAGFSGLISLLAANLLALLMGYSPYYVKNGFYGFNSLLVGLGVGLYFQPAWEMTLLVILASILTLFVGLFLQGVLYKYSLPFLSVPFLIGIWVVMLASSDFSAMGLSERGIYQANEIYAVGGQPLVNLYFEIQSWKLPESIGIFLNSLGAIFFQSNWLAGLLILLGLLLFSRIAFSLSILGFYVAYLFYGLIGADINELSYTYIGFNFILTSIALGGFYIVPSLFSYLWIVLLLPIVVLVTISSMHWFGPYRLSIYALPFNLVTLLFLYILKLRYYPGKRLLEVAVQHNSPEKNLYFFKHNFARGSARGFSDFQLPFLGEWTVAQAHDGEYTHKDDWRHAWDFVVEDDKGKQYRNQGAVVKDYYCYDKTILSPADGEVVNLLDGVPDNEIGKINMVQNWGNSLVMLHSNGVYSQLSHFKKGSFRVKKGDLVKKGDVLGACGNSGRSPYPHLHFQFQATPYIGSATLEVSLPQYMRRVGAKLSLESFSFPEENSKLMRGEAHPLLMQTLAFQPGQKFTFEVISEEHAGFVDAHSKWEFEVKSDSVKNTFLYCHRTHSLAYFRLEGNVLSFYNYIGSRRSLLYYLYLALFKVYLGFYKDLDIVVEMPPNQVYGAGNLFLQDFVAPFYLYLQTKYHLVYSDIVESLSPEKIVLNSRVGNNDTSPRVFQEAEIVVKSGGEVQVRIYRNEKVLEVICGNMQLY